VEESQGCVFFFPPLLPTPSFDAASLIIFAFAFQPRNQYTRIPSQKTLDPLQQQAVRYDGQRTLKSLASAHWAHRVRLLTALTYLVIIGVLDTI